MTATNVVTGVQDAYVRKTIDTLNDLPNVLWVVSEEAPTKSTWWNGHLISLVKDYERDKPYQHPVGYATLESPPDSVLYNSDADWVAPSVWVSPTTSCGTGKPACKVNINDSDHSYFGMWNDTPQKNRDYAWQNFLNGNQVLFMDPLPSPLPARESELVSFPGQRHRRRPRPSLGEFPQQSRLCSAVFAQAQPGQCHPQGFTVLDQILPGANSVRGRRVPGLYSCRRCLHHGSFGHARLAEARR